MADNTANAMRDCLISPNVPDSNLEPANVVDVIAGAGLNISRALRSLGVGDAATNMGAIEHLAAEVRDGTTRMAEAISELAAAVREHAN